MNVLGCKAFFILGNTLESPGVGTKLVKGEGQALGVFKVAQVGTFSLCHMQSNANGQLQFRTTGVKSQDFQRSLVPNIFITKQKKGTMSVIAQHYS